MHINIRITHYSIVQLLITTFILMSINLFSYGQNQEERPLRYFDTQKEHDRLLSEHEAYAENLAKMEQFIKEYGETGNERIDEIPVVFHILYNERQAYPSLEQVQFQLEVLNDFYGKYRKPIEPFLSSTLQEYAEMGQDLGISFCATSIEFIPTNIMEWENDNSIKSSDKGGVDPWSTEKFLNIWVGNLKENIGGYAQMPEGPIHTDGIVIDFNFFGNEKGTAVAPYHQGKTLCHLVGNYLGLYDLWDEDEPCKDDRVADTPIHNAPNFELINDGTKHISFCPNAPIEMSMNLMDNSDDKYLTMMTLGQKSRIKAVLSKEGSRGELTHSEYACMEEVGKFANKSKSLLSQQNSFLLYPNPSSDKVTILLESLGEEARVVVFNSMGVKVLDKPCTLLEGTHQLELNCSSWSVGNYLVNVYFANQERQTKTLQITR